VHKTVSKRAAVTDRSLLIAKLELNRLAFGLNGPLRNHKH
jgi:hypothetical protein